MSDENPPVPPKLSWDEMEAGILNKMEEIEASTPSTPFWQDRRGILFLFLIGMAILLIPILCVPSVNEIAGLRPAPDQGLVSKGPNTSAADHLSPSPSTTAKNLTPALELATTEHDLFPSNSPAQSTTNKQAITPQKSLNTTTVLNPSNTTIKSNPALNTKTTSKPSTIKPIANTSKRAISTTNTSSKSDHTPVDNTSSQVFPKTSSLDHLSPLSTKTFLLSQPALASAPLNIDSITLSQSVQKRKTFQKDQRLTVHSGLSLWNMGLSGSSPEWAALEQTLPSYHLQVNYIHPLPKNFSVLIGLQYQRLESRFDWSGRIEDFDLTLRDTIVRIEVDVLTREETEIRGDVELRVAAERRIRSFNSVQFYQLPFALGKTWRHKNWQSDFLVGGTLNFSAVNRGKTLFNGQIATYEGTSGRFTDFYDLRWNLQAMLMGRVAYRISEQLGISAGVQLQKALSTWRTDGNGTMRPGIINLELGMSYAW